ncbi:MAG: hypothetical protein WCF78_03425 [archaeon]
MTSTKQIQAVDLVKSLFESIHGNLGLLKFSLEELKPINGDGDNSERWVVICSFYKKLLTDCFKCNIVYLLSDQI